MLRPLLIALQFLTRLPLPRTILKTPDYQPQQLGRSVLFYPVAGLLIGGILYLVVFGLAHLFPELSPMAEAAIVLSCWVLLTGALHLDGLSDSADAWVGGYGDRDRTLVIMKDPYCGPAGVVIIVLVLLLKFSALVSVVKTAWPALLLSPLIGRATILLLFLTTPYVRKEGIGAQQAEHMPRVMAWLILIVIMTICGYWLKYQAIGLLLLCSTVFFLLRRLMILRLGGTTGDTVGAMVEVTEVVVLFALLV